MSHTNLRRRIHHKEISPISWNLHHKFLVEVGKVVHTKFHAATETHFTGYGYNKLLGLNLIIRSFRCFLSSTSNRFILLVPLQPPTMDMHTAHT